MNMSSIPGRDMRFFLTTNITCNEFISVINYETGSNNMISSLQIF
jgi:hypothetical protein